MKRMYDKTAWNDVSKEASSETSSLEVQNLRKSYGSRYQLKLDELSLYPGQFYFLLGPNGSGKTTFFNLMTGMITPEQGQVKICTYSLADHATHALACLGVVFQESTLDLDLTVTQNLMFHGALQGLDSSSCLTRIHEEAKRFKIEDVLTRKVRHLNAGHRRRVEIARSLIHKPKLLLLDEPSTGLDIESRDLILQHIHYLCKKKNLSAIWCTHLIEEAHKADHILILKQGSICFRGSPEQLCSQGESQHLSSAYQKLLLAKSQSQQYA